MRINKKSLGLALLLIGINFANKLQAAEKVATVRINSSVSYQKITGFGGFVCSPQFGYNHMSTDEIKMLWGKNSKTGYNIMRLFLPIGKDGWKQSLETARLAKSLGLIVFASPWSMPAEWKTNNSTAGVVIDGNGKEQIGYLKKEHYEDYANYLNDYVTYLRENGIELDAIALQNEPDYKVSYAGCMWTPQEMTDFLKNYGHIINCKIIAPESVGISDSYANAFMNDEAALAELDIFGGHQYGYIQEDFKKLHAKDKEIWMTEYLINWNANSSTSRNYDWTLDAFDFAKAVNTALLANVNAWVHYTTKRYYGMMGDGTCGTASGSITKRGYILSHYAKYVTGTTRINCTWKDESSVLQGSSYLSATGDSVIVMVINPSSDSYTLTVDLPFYSISGKSIKTTKFLSMSSSDVQLSTETCRPKVAVSPSSVTTFIFTKSSERSISQMTGEAVHYNKIDDQTVTNSAFGFNYKLSGKTVTFDHNNNLISSNTNSSKGYLKLAAQYNQLVFYVKEVTSTMNYTSDNTTLYYINSKGTANSYNYGRVDFNHNTNFEWTFDISRSVLTDGCTGIIGFSNSNYSSILTIEFGDVYFKTGNESMYKFTGIYSKEDSDLLDCLENPSCTSLDFTEVTGITAEQDWNVLASNKNCIYYVGDNVTNSKPNIIAGTDCSNLVLTDDGGSDFYVPASFTARAASYTRTFDGYGMMILPFEAAIPNNVKIYTLQLSASEMICTPINTEVIPANTPVLVVATGTVIFEGSGEVSTPLTFETNKMNGVYIATQVPIGSYCLKVVDGEPAFYKITTDDEQITSFNAYFNPATTLAASSLLLKFSDTNAIEQTRNDKKSGKKIMYDLGGRRVNSSYKGIVIYEDGSKGIVF